MGNPGLFYSSEKKLKKKDKNPVPYEYGDTGAENWNYNVSTDGAFLVTNSTTTGSNAYTLSSAMNMK